MRRPSATSRYEARATYTWWRRDPTTEREQRGHRPVLVISPTEFNEATKLPVILPITNGGEFARRIGFAVAISGIATTGIVRCDQPRVLGRGRTSRPQGGHAAAGDPGGGSGPRSAHLRLADAARAPPVTIWRMPRAAAADMGDGGNPGSGLVRENAFRPNDPRGGRHGGPADARPGANRRRHRLRHATAHGRIAGPSRPQEQAAGHGRPGTRDNSAEAAARSAATPRYRRPVL